MLFPILLDSEGLRRAWPLVRLALPELSLGDWIAHGRRYVGRGALPQRGMLGLTCDRGYLFGLVAFTREGPAPALLEVDPIACADLGQAEDPRATLVDALLGFARMLGCARLRLRPRPGFFSPMQLAPLGFVETEQGFERATALNATDSRTT